MKLSIGPEVTGGDLDKLVTYCHEIGIDYLTLNALDMDGWNKKGYLTIDDIKAYVKRFEDAGLTIAEISLGYLWPDLIFGEHTKHTVKLVYPRRDTMFTVPLDNLCRSIDALGEAGVSNAQLGAGWLLKSRNKEERTEQWKRLVSWYQEIGEHAEKADVWVGTEGGYGQLDWWLGDYESFSKILEVVPNKRVGVTFCVGCIYTAGNRNIPETAKGFGKRIINVHSRNLKKNKYQPEEYKSNEMRTNAIYKLSSGAFVWMDPYGETWLDALPDQGVVDYPKLIDVLHEVGFKGVIYVQHLPRVFGEENREISTAYTAAYLKGLLTGRGY